MADSDRKETFITKSHNVLAHCCEAMRLGSYASVEISGIRISGDVYSIRRMDDGQFQISIRVPA